MGPKPSSKRRAEEVVGHTLDLVASRVEAFDLGLVDFTYLPSSPYGEAQR